MQITKAFLFIHTKEYIHHDIKLANILIKKNLKNDGYEVKISDFGTCLKKNSVPGLNDGKILTGITKNYSSPENILHCLFGATFENDDRSDIWSLGVVFYRLFVKNANFVFPWTHLINQDRITIITKV